jgi:hypothetical protein
MLPDDALEEIVVNWLRNPPPSSNTPVRYSQMLVSFANRLEAYPCGVAALYRRIRRSDTSANTTRLDQTRYSRLGSYGTQAPT